MVLAIAGTMRAQSRPIGPVGSAAVYSNPVLYAQGKAQWLARLETGKVTEVQRPVIKIPLSGEPSEVTRRNAISVLSGRGLVEDQESGIHRQDPGQRHQLAPR